MQKINCENYKSHFLFNVEVDFYKQKCNTVRYDSDGNLIYRVSEEYHIGNAYSAISESFLINKEEYMDLLDQALENGHITGSEYRELEKFAD